MRKINFWGLLGCLIIISTVSGNYYDITTVYKFNSVEESDQKGETSITYLNTCTVAVYPQSNAVGLPYYNIQNTTETNNIIFPLESPAVPTLENPSYKQSKWQMLSEATIETKAMPGIDILKKKKDIRDIFQSLNEESTTLGMVLKDSPYSSTIFDVDEMSAINLNSNIFFYVAIPTYNTQDIITLVLERHRGGGTLQIIISKIYKQIEFCSSNYAECEEYVYQENTYNQIELYMSLKGDIKIYDVISKKVIPLISETQFLSETSRKTYSKILYEGPQAYHFFLFKIVQVSELALMHNKVIMSPWIEHLKNGSTIFVTVYRKSGANLTASIMDQGTKTLERLRSEVQSIITIPSLNKDSKVEEMVLIKIHVEFPQTWVQAKQIQLQADTEVYIKDVWEGGDLEMYKIHETKTCAKRDITEIYDVALKDPRQNRTIASCYNGGFPDQHQETCVCPPGFTGDACEIACGRNSYGQKCSMLCSVTGSECKGMVLCTPGYGCSCAPGYHGNQCSEQCEAGTYGADCKQTCGQCKDGCDKYTGDCRGECDTPYLAWPSCKYPTSYWNKAPEVVDSGFTSIKLRLNFSTSNTGESLDDARFYMVQYKEAIENALWSNGSYKIFSPSNTEYVVQNLKPGVKYFFRVLLFDKRFKASDPKFSNISEGITNCSVSEVKNNLNVTKVTNNSVTLVWNKESSDGNGTECTFSSYILDIEGFLHGTVENRKIKNVKRNSFVVKSLIPGFSYNMKLKKSTILGESAAIAETRVTIVTQKSQDDDSLEVPGVLLKKNGSEIFVQWFRSSLYNTYYIKYKLVRLLSCGHDELQSPLQVVSTSNTNYTLSLKPNALYEIFVTGDENQSTSSNMELEVTDGKLPDIAPSFVKQKFRVSNEKAQIHWTDPPSSCKQMNGFFEKYVIELLNNNNVILQTYETKEKKMEITGLVAKTAYIVRIRYLNHVGTNYGIYEEDVFTTRETSFLTAQNLTAYKVSANMIGIRWKIPTPNSKITGITIKVKTKSINITNPDSIQCKAWPAHVCYDITELKPNTKHTVSVEILSEEFPEGGSPQSIQVVTRESVPNPVTDIKVVDISNTNLTISWRIPFMLNGILRKFLLEVEHLSSFDESLCCQSISTINYLVTEEKEIYTHVIENIQNTSSYQVTIRALTKRLGQEARKIIDIPPPSLLIRFAPRITIDYKPVLDWEDQNLMSDTPGNELVGDKLVIVLSDEDTESTDNSSSLRTELSQHLKSNNWWLAGVCTANDEDCAVNIGDAYEGGESSYGEIRNKPLKVGHNYTIVVAQVNKYLTARSFTIAKSVPIQMKDRSTVSTTGTLVETTPQYTTTESIPQDIREDTEGNGLEEPAKQDDVISDIDNADEVVTEEPVIDYDEEVDNS